MSSVPRTRRELSRRSSSYSYTVVSDRVSPLPLSPEAAGAAACPAAAAAALSAAGDSDLEAPLLGRPAPFFASAEAAAAGGAEASPVAGLSDAAAAAAGAFASPARSAFGAGPPAPAPADAALRRRLDRALLFSWIVNLLLMAAKAWAVVTSGSKAVLASAADSAVDLASQAVIAWAEGKARRPDPRFPVGAARLEVVGVLVCACIMSAASYAVIAASAQDLWRGLMLRVLPEVEMGAAMYAVLAAATLLKAGCYLQCAALRSGSDAMVALAEDHLNDVASNVMAVATALASQAPWPSWLPGAAAAAAASSGAGSGQPARLWFVDPLGAVLISLWIVSRWLEIFRDAVDKLCGRDAPLDFYLELQRLAREHHPGLVELDVVRAYSVGARFLVEVEVTMPENTILRVSHDLALALQHRIEALPQTERCFVHVDYEARGALEHKAERALFGDRAGAEAAALAMGGAQRSGSLGNGSTGGGRGSGGGGGNGSNGGARRSSGG